MSKITFDEMAEISGSEKSFRNKVFANALKLGGELIPKEQLQWAKKRIEKCKSCPFVGKVNAEGLIKETDGCTICGCPLLTKPFYKSHPLGADCPKGFWNEIDAKYSD